MNTGHLAQIMHAHAFAHDAAEQMIDAAIARAHQHDGRASKSPRP